MKMIVRVWMGVLLAIGPAVFGQSEKTTAAPQAHTTKQADPTDQVKPSAPEVTLVEAGAEPRRVYRYAPPVGARHTLTMSMKITSRTELDGKKGASTTAPEVIVGMDIAVLDVAANGDITYEMTFSRAEVGQVSGTPTAAVEQIRKNLATIIGLKGRTTLTSRGETKEAELTLPENADPMLKQTVESMTGSFRQLSIPLPVEAVGTGAQWRVVHHMNNNGVTMDQTATMTLTKAEAESIDMDVLLSQTAPEQEIKTPTVGSKATLLGAEGKGEGKLTASMSSIVPVESSMRIQTEQRMAVIAKGESRRMKQDMIARITMSAVPAKP